MDGKDFKRTFKKIWWFLWEDESIWSLLVNIVLAFILIKFVIYPGLGFALQTDYPIVAVVSGSMEHKAVHPCIEKNNQNICTKTNKQYYEICGNVYSTKQETNLDAYWEKCGPWYEQNANITKSDFENFKYKNGFNTGDIMILHGYGNVKEGDILVFWGNQNYPIIHRVVKVTEINGKKYYQTKGDHNKDSINVPELSEYNISEDRVIGKAGFRIPYLGWIKLGLVKLFNLGRF